MSGNTASKRQQNISIKVFRYFAGRKYDGVFAWLSIAKTGIEEIANTSFAHVAIGLLMIMSSVIAPNVSAQKASSQFELRSGREGVWKTYRYVDGLASNDVRAIMQDKEGAMWFGTEGGVSRFDGKHWQTYTERDKLVSNSVRAIIQDEEGAIWIGTDWGGVSQFDGKSWQTYNMDDGLASNGVNAIMQDSEGAIWFGTGDGVSWFDGKSWQTYTQKDGLAD
ncbi:hypothetical protein H8E77_27260, partial [bacterium]|nr:hypothetical protein [bacterium]